MPFITFEGGEGSGKTSQVALAAAELRTRRLPVVETREPGGTSIGAKIRAILLDVEHTHLDPAAEWLLYEADRRQHVVESLSRDAASGAFVLCDRYSDTTEAYQQVGRGLDRELVQAVDALARNGLRPDLTLLYDLPPEEGLARARSRDRHVGRFEGTHLDFHRRIRDAYLAIARREPDRVRVIAAGPPPDQVFQETWRHIAERFSL